MTRLAIIAALLAAPVVAQERHEWTNGGTVAWVELHHPTADGATASVTFENRQVHTGSENFTLTLGGLTVTVALDFHVNPLGAERITVTPPEGFFAWPESIDVNEDDRGTLHIYSMGVLS